VDHLFLKGLFGLVCGGGGGGGGGGGWGGAGGDLIPSNPPQSTPKRTSPKLFNGTMARRVNVVLDVVVVWP
jgi:hypothetical protein